MMLFVPPVLATFCEWAKSATQPTNILFQAASPPWPGVPKRFKLTALEAAFVTTWCNALFAPASLGCDKKINGTKILNENNNYLGPD
jgi:hypothetical protein